MKKIQNPFMSMKSIYSLLCVLSLSLYANFAQAQTYTIYPIPQKVTMGSRSVELTPQINFICEEGIDQFTRDRAQEVFEKAGYTLVEATAPSQTLTNLYLGVNGSNGTADQYAGNNDLPLSVFTPANNKFDAHLLQINGNSPHGDMVILGDENGSAFYAFATLEQMFEQAGGNALGQITFEDYSHTQYRGIVEGFYGHPYTVDNRISLFEFCKRFKMNIFIYGPKSDPYHLGNWRDDYPTSVTDSQRHLGMITQDDLRTIAAAARKNHVSFIWAAHPGLEQGISFSNESSVDSGIDDLMDKFQHLYDLGIRGFGVFIDDMRYTPSGNMQAYLANTTQVQLREQFPSKTPEDKISPLFFIPTAYALNYSTSSTLTSLASVDKEVVIGFTGYDCFSNVRASSVNDMANRVGRNPLMWWNNPVNDDHEDRIYMRELTAHWTIEQEGPIATLNSIVSNPMNQAQASKVALFGVADYAWNPATFDARQNWEESFSHIAQPGDTETAEVLKTFARFSNSTIEETEMISLFTNFQNKYSKGSLPDEAVEIYNRLTELNEACIYIENMQNSPIKDYQLIYKDLLPWNAKLKAMSTIVLDALDLLNSDIELSRSEGWAKSLRLKPMFDGLNTDSIYMVSALEESGTKSRETFYLVTPSNNYFRPFVNFLVGQTDTSISCEWPENEQPQVITNIEGGTTATLSITDDNYSLNGLTGTTLCKGEYIGLYFADVLSISVDELELPANIIVETSINGKLWNETRLPINDFNTAYIRLKNCTENDATINFGSLPTRVIFNEIEDTPTASTNMSTYLDNTIDKIVDGNPSSIFYSSKKQLKDNYILLTFSGYKPRYEITITFSGGDILKGTAVIELSPDNNTWETVAEFSESDIDNNLQYSCNAAGRQARYVRFRITDDRSTANWLQVAEFTVTTTEATATFSRTVDNNGLGIISLSDKNLNTGFQSSAAGYIQHEFIENINIESIEIYHNTTFDQQYPLPTISIYNGEEWIEKGYLNSYVTIVDTKDEKMVTSLKITWTDNNIPNLYEIFPTGTPYTEPSPSGIEGNTTVQPVIYNHGSLIFAQEGNYTIDLYDTQGRQLLSKRLQARIGKVFTFDVDVAQGLYYVVVSKDSKRVNTFKVVL